MDSLERLFYSVAAMAAALAVLLFGFYFNLGDMLLAAFRGPGAFQEWAYRKNLRTAERLGVPDEVRVDGRHTDRHLLGRGETAGGLPFAAYNGPPDFGLDHRLKRERMHLVKQGITSDRFLEMEALFRADRAHLSTMHGVDQMVTRGDPLAAYEELEALLARMDSRNLRALAEILTLRGKLLVMLNAPPNRLYDHVMQELEMRKRILEIELEGYRGVPKFARHFAAAQYRIQRIEAMIQDFRGNRTKALTTFATGAYGVDYLNEDAARMIKAAVQREEARGMPEDEARKIRDLVDRRRDALERAEESGEPLSPLGP